MNRRVSGLLIILLGISLYPYQEAAAQSCCPGCPSVGGSIGPADGSTPPTGFDPHPTTGGPRPTQGCTGADVVLHSQQCGGACETLTGGNVSFSYLANWTSPETSPPLDSSGGATTIVPLRVTSTFTYGRGVQFYFNVYDSGTFTCSPGGCGGSGPNTKLYARFGTIKGQVLHRSGIPLPGVLVAAYPKEPPYVPGSRVTRTDQNGNFDFTQRDAAFLLNDNGFAPTDPPGQFFVPLVVPIREQNNWGLLLCGDTSTTECSSSVQEAHRVERDFYVVAGYAVRPRDHSSRAAVTVSSSRDTQVTFTFQEDPDEPDPDDRPEQCEATAGNPVSLLTGNVFFDTTDVQVPGPLGSDIALTRRYNSKNTATGRHGLFGPGWTLSYERRLERLPPPGPTASPSVMRLRDEQGLVRDYIDPDGDQIFTPTRPFNNDEWIDANAHTRYFRRGGREVYGGPNGKLSEIVGPNFGTIRFEYQFGGPYDGRLKHILGGGRELSFGFQDNQITLSDADRGLVATYVLNNGLLESVTYAALAERPGPEGYRYTYDPITKELLTVADLSGRFIEKHQYVNGRATVSEIADGRERYDITYEENRTLVTDARKQTTIYELGDARARRVVTKVIGACAACGGGQELQEWTYDPVTGKKATYRDGAGNLTRYEYDAATLELLTETRYPDRKNPKLTYVTRYTYWPDGRIKSVEDPKGGLTEWTYNAVGPETTTTKISATESRMTRFTYQFTGDGTRLHTITDPRNKTTELTWQGGRPRTIKDPLENVTTLQHDLGGNLQRLIRPATDIPSEEPKTYYDLRGRVRFIVNPGGNVNEAAGTCTNCWRHIYDGGGRLIARTDPLNNRTTLDYDPYGRLEYVKEWEDAQTPRVTQYGYDLMSNLEFIRDARGKETRFVYDDFNRVWKIQYPGHSAADPREEVFTYDGAGQAFTRTDRRGILTKLTHDGVGQLTKREYAGPGITPYAVEFGYDRAGNLELAREGTMTLSWIYDLAHQMRYYSDGRSSLSPTYDLAGNRESISLAETGFALTYHYDDAGRLKWIRQQGSKEQEFTFGYDAASRRRTLRFPNQAMVEYTPDLLSRLGALTVTSPGQPSPLLSWLFPSRSLFKFGYRHNDDWSIGEKKVDGVPERYKYDALHRLTTATEYSALRGTLTERYQYDAVGNRKASLTVPNPDQWVYSDRNELRQAGALQMDYDRNGNLIRKTDANGVWTYDWDAQSRLTKVSLNLIEVARFEYDPLDRRVKKVARGETLHYSYDGVDVVREMQGADATGPTRHYVHGPGIDEPLGQVQADQSTWYYHSDGLGSIVGATDQAGNIVQSRHYDAFGNLQAGATEAGYAFTGREWDPEIGLYYYRARYYDPAVGRFISEDPIGFDGGINFYAYVGNDPVNLRDPSGLIEDYWERAIKQIISAIKFLLQGGRGAYRAGAGGANFQNEFFGDITMVTEKFKLKIPTGSGLNANLGLLCLINDCSSIANALEQCRTSKVPLTCYWILDEGSSQIRYICIPTIGGPIGST